MCNGEEPADPRNSCEALHQSDRLTMALKDGTGVTRPGRKEPVDTLGRQQCSTKTSNDSSSSVPQYAVSTVHRFLLEVQTMYGIFTCTCVPDCAAISTSACPHCSVPIHLGAVACPDFKLSKHDIHMYQYP